MTAADPPPEPADIEVLSFRSVIDGQAVYTDPVLYVDGVPIPVHAVRINVVWDDDNNLPYPDTDLRYGLNRRTGHIELTILLRLESTITRYPNAMPNKEHA